MLEYRITNYFIRVMHDAPPLELVSPAPVTPQPKSYSIRISHAL